MTILLLEDDRFLGESIQEILIDAGYCVEWVQEGEAAAEAAYANTYDLYIFDINVPEINGFDLLAGLRDAEDQTPTIFISALTDLASISKGFTAGADDYLKKPFYPEELLLRIEAKFSRKQKQILYGGIRYNPLSDEVTRDEKSLSLGEVQHALLRLFITNIGRTLSKESLFDVMEHPSDTALRVAINKLKQTTGWEIHNLRGIGYKIE